MLNFKISSYDKAGKLQTSSAVPLDFARQLAGKTVHLHAFGMTTKSDKPNLTTGLEITFTDGDGLEVRHDSGDATLTLKRGVYKETPAR
jgi:hypothetical protein